MLDLHIHSNYSDGTCTIKEIVLEAKNKNISLIALTDHNTFNGCSEFSEITKKYNQPALSGIEISTIYNNEEIHLLAYFPINSNFYYSQYDDLIKINNNYKNGKKEQLEKMIENISKDYNVSINEFNEFLKNNNITNINRVHLANYLISKNIVNNIKSAFDNFLNEESKYYVKKEQTNLLDAIKAVKYAGGIPIIAHLKQYNFNNDEINKLLKDVSNITNDFGIELIYYDHNKKDINNYMNLCNNFSKKNNINIIYTIGSDFHGDNKPNKIGEPYDYLPDSNFFKLQEKISKDFINFINDKFQIKENINREI